jgi:hypothetical protein
MNKRKKKRTLSFSLATFIAVADEVRVVAHPLGSITSIVGSFLN